MATWLPMSTSSGRVMRTQSSTRTSTPQEWNWPLSYIVAPLAQPRNVVQYSSICEKIEPRAADAFDPAGLILLGSDTKGNVAPDCCSGRRRQGTPTVDHDGVFGASPIDRGKLRKRQGNHRDIRLIETACCVRTKGYIATYSLSALLHGLRIPRKNVAAFGAKPADQINRIGTLDYMGPRFVGEPNN